MEPWGVPWGCPAGGFSCSSLDPDSEVALLGHTPLELCWPSLAVWCPHLSLRKLGFVFSSMNSLPICNVRLFDDSDLQPARPRDTEALPGHFAAFPSHPAFCCQTAQTCVCSDIHLGEGDTSRGLGTNLGVWGGSPHPTQSTVTVAEPRLPLSAARQANKSGGKLWGLEIMTSIEKLAD